MITTMGTTSRPTTSQPFSKPSPTHLPPSLPNLLPPNHPLPTPKTQSARKRRQNRGSPDTWIRTGYQQIAGFGAAGTMANGLMSFSLPVDFSSFRHRQKGPRARQDACKLLGAWDSLRKRFEVSGLEENKEGVYAMRIIIEGVLGSRR
ncbi:hypothetical protein K443DRAFT_484080 [Laccaria amethystina LaAM-08-1]|uniref:Uncharacterized protein n=1 Tax=Laccaria amethystina LaAM-08-1 TaxID=1095629 RepID=A0A0C9XZR0_9AGAR|nr:hypothetical protein K443DRAFT_484080 [Laccaria amethystina LaAM-08-1]